MLPFCFIGGIAIQRWGEPRVTKDVDLTVFSGFKNEEKLIDLLCSKFPMRESNAKEFALANRVLLLKSPMGPGIDISLGGLPYEELLINRSSDFLFAPTITLRTCSAEDLIILKAFAARGRDWNDVETVIIRQKNQLDWIHIETYLAQLLELKEEPELLDILRKLRQKLSSQ